MAVNVTRQGNTLTVDVTVDVTDLIASPAADGDKLVIALNRAVSQIQTQAEAEAWATKPVKLPKPIGKF